jgi:hypothetical protein
MRNYADEILFIEIARAERRTPQTTILPSKDTCAHIDEAKRPRLRARWVWVDGKLELRWSDDWDEPLRGAA